MSNGKQCSQLKWMVPRHTVLSKCSSSVTGHGQIQEFSEEGAGWQLQNMSL